MDERELIDPVTLEEIPEMRRGIQRQTTPLLDDRYLVINARPPIEFWQIRNGVEHMWEHNQPDRTGDYFIINFFVVAAIPLVVMMMYFINNPAFSAVALIITIFLSALSVYLTSQF